MNPMSTPRKIRLDLATPPEVAIRAAMHAVEAMGADPRLTSAIQHLSTALDFVSAHVDDEMRLTDLGPERRLVSEANDGSWVRRNPDVLPPYRKRPALSPNQAHWMLTRVINGKGDVSTKAMAEWCGEIQPDPEQLNPPIRLPGQ